jgi:MFS family permease
LSAATDRIVPALLWPFKTLYYGWAIASVSMAMSFVTVSMYGPVLSVWVKPIRDDMGWTATEIAIAFTIGSFLGSMFTAAFGRMLDRRGARAVSTIAGMIVAGMLVGLVFMQQPWHMWIFFGLGRAAAIAGVQFGTTVAVANWFIQKRGRASSLVAFGQRFGQASVPMMVLPIILIFSWRHAYGILAVATVVLVVVPSFLYIRRRPEDYGLLPDGGSRAVTNGGFANAHQAALAAIDAVPWTVREAMRTRAFWMIVITISMMGFGQTATNLHAAASVQERGASYAQSTTIVLIFAMISALTTFPWGWLADRIHIRFVIMLAAALQIVAMLIIASATTYLQSVAFAVVSGAAAGSWTIGFRVLIPNYFERRSSGAIRGATAPITAFIGPVGPTLAGVIRDATGTYDLAFTIFAGVFAVAFVAMFLARPPTHHTLQAPAPAA